jgi:anti-anti-sigma regulatory factor
MIHIKKSGEGKYTVSFRKGTETIDKRSGYQLEKECRKFLKENREITVDLKGVRSMDNHGFSMLEELFDMASKKHCHMHFINVGGEIKKRIDTLGAVPLDSEDMDEYFDND